MQNDDDWLMVRINSTFKIGSFTVVDWLIVSDLVSVYGLIDCGEQLVREQF